MIPNKAGQVVKFHSPYPDEDPNQLYVVLEVFDHERPRADIQALNTGLSFPPVNSVNLDDLEIVEVETKDLIGHQVTISTSDSSKVTGKVVQVRESKILLDMTKGGSDVATNVYLTIRDYNGIEHTGTLLVG
ncbi:hypothetical protein HNV11_23650 (plasmid) [Spirosoma taeanense]|uniref:Uncharacterized protein n=1 Tax=Spirosoma taeanense TaxID=2735870 RepID=A0A6M5YGK3_9BACT|nr:hypothetical protein [Spirosoma taeanense]QJW92470.1 hypothetical protein HNV11_23650 [Spirosoma taeanense]